MNTRKLIVIKPLFVSIIVLVSLTVILPILYSLTPVLIDDAQSDYRVLYKLL